MKRKIMAVFLSILFLCVGGCSKSNEKSNLTVMAGKETIQSFSVDPAGKSPTRDNQGIFKPAFEKDSQSSIRYIKNNETVTLDFGGNSPDKVVIDDNLLASTGCAIYTDKEINEYSLSKKSGKYSFTLKKHLASALSSLLKKDKTNFRGFKVTASWNNKAYAYAFVLKTDGY